MPTSRVGCFVKRQSDALLIAVGHAATHWIIATIYVILPFLGKELGLTFAQIGGLVSVFHAAAFVANFGSGPLVDITGRYLTAAWLSLVVGGFALIAFGLGSDLFWLSAAVLVIGLTNNLWHPAAISILSRAYPASRGFALSIHTLGATLGDILAPLCAGALMIALNWQWTAIASAAPVFLIAAAVAIFGRRIPGHTEIKSKPSGTSEDSNYRIAFRKLVTDPAVLALCIMAGFRSMTQNGLLLFLPLLLVNELGAGPLLVGFTMAGIQAGAIISGPVAGAASDRLGRKPVVLAGLAVTMIVIAVMNTVSNVSLFIALACVLGFAMFAVRPVIHGWSLDLAEARMSGSVISLLFGTQSGFTMLVPVLGGLVADVWGLSATLYLLTATMLVATVMVALIPSDRAQTSRLA